MKGERELASKAKHDPKLIHTYTRRKMDVKEEIRALKDNEGRLTVDCPYFQSVFVKESMGTLPEFEKRTNISFGIERVLNKIDEHGIEKRLKTLMK